MRREARHCVHRGVVAESSKADYDTPLKGLAFQRREEASIVRLGLLTGLFLRYECVECFYTAICWYVRSASRRCLLASLLETFENSSWAASRLDAGLLWLASLVGWHLGCTCMYEGLSSLELMRFLTE